MSVRVKFFRFLLCGVLLTSTASSVFFGKSAYAATQIDHRSLILKDGATDGGSKVSGVVNHEFQFTVHSGASVGSIKFEYCNEAVGPGLTPEACTTPTGLTTNGGLTTMSYEHGAIGFTLNKTTNGAPFIHRTAGVIANDTVLNYRLSDITNPSVLGSFFVRISSYTSLDTTGTVLDYGVVTASTASQIVLTGIMPESLIFCAGATVPINGSVPNCAGATSGAISFNQLFSPSDTATASSQSALSTNSLYGYSLSVYGPTLTSGSNTVAAMAGGVGVRGTSQFGMNLKLNTVGTSTPAVGTEVSPTPNGAELKGQASSGYDTADSFKFVAGVGGNVIAASDNDGAGPTNAQIFTTSYIVNVAGSQLAGTYVTTLTYIATATF